MSGLNEFFIKNNIEQKVFFSSALSAPGAIRQEALEAQSQLKNAVEQHIASTEKDKSHTKIITALDFLSRAASNERTKELKFFQNFRSQYPGVEDLFKDFKLEDIENDYITFITNINKTLRGITNFKRQVNDEIAREQRYKDSRQYTFNGEIKAGMKKDFFNALTANNTAYSAKESIFTTDVEKRIKGLFNDKTLEGKLTTIVLQSAGPMIISAIKSGNLNLNSANFVSLINILTSYLQNMIMTDKGKLSVKTIQNYGKEMAESEEFKQYVSNLLENETLNLSLTSVSNSFGMNSEAIKSIDQNGAQIRRLSGHLKNKFKNIENIGSFQEWVNENPEQLNFNEIAAAASTISVQAYVSGENMSFGSSLSAGLSAIASGRSQATDDILLGYLHVIPHVNINQGKIISEYRAKLAELNQKYEAAITKTTDLNSFEKNTWELKQLREERYKLLQELAEKLNLGEDAIQKGLLSHINIHDTVKGYISAGGSFFSSHGGFEGASFGSNLNEQLKIMASTNMDGGINASEIEFFEWALINSGSNMIGSGVRSSLEHYFSVFAGFLMFNDASLMIQDAQEYLQEQVIDYSSVDDIHLYDLNGVFVPSSYLLQQTWETLSNIYTSLETEAASGMGMRVSIHTYKGEPINNDWQATYNAAKSATKMEIRFMAGFSNLLDSISSTMQGL